MTGVTFLAFGNGSPDVFSTFAAMSTNSGSLAVGELFGAAGFITAVVSGSMALIRPFHVARRSFIRDVGFFVVAAAFSMVFLWDGKLDLWECMTMVLFYVFYVAFVVAWHWWLGRRRRKRDKEAAARGHYVATQGEELEIEEEEYHDDPDEAGSRPSVSRGVSREDWSALERGGDAQHGEQLPDEDEEEEARDRWMSDLNSNMRLTRPPQRSRKSTLTPVRPSLVGALEFQAVLKSLQKSRNIQTYPMDTRRYSDDPTYTTAQQQDQMSTVSDPAARPPYTIALHDDDEARSPELQRRTGGLEVPGGRPRAVSANDAAHLRLDPAGIEGWSGSRRGSDGQSEENLIDFTERDPQSQSYFPHQRQPSLEVPQRGSALQPTSPTVHITPAEDDEFANATFANAPSRVDSFGDRSTPRIATSNLAPDYLRESDSPSDSPRSVPKAQRLPKIVIPGRTRSRSHTSTPSSSPFPRYRDDPSPPGSRPPSIYLPPAASIASPESLPPDQSAEQETPRHPTRLHRWWPYRTLPPPGVLISTLFPTIYHWYEKNWWERCLGIVAAPSVFLLTITLPVVESGKDDEEQKRDVSHDSARTKSVSTPFPESSEHGAAGGGDTATVAVGIEQHHRHSHHGSGSGSSHAINTQMPGAITTTELTAEPEEQQQEGPELWNRWLLICQLLLAPLFIVLAIYSQSPTDITPRWLLKPCLICLLISLLLLIPLLLTTTPTHKPAAFRHILSLAGFIVSISWISTIAAQVVGALKALAVILNMSHAIMGLTIFAVGNSLGDLVADVTVAKLGYPVMALSACFGGPMLNILLGIGLSGSYILIRGANERMHKHPDKDYKFKPYHIEVENTLIVSGATLLVTLAGLLVAVPLNRWVLSKRIGWALIALWTVSTVGNVVIEVTGLNKGKEELVGW